MNDICFLSEEEIQQRLTSTQETISEESYLSAFLPDSPRPAAVLVPLLRASVNNTGRTCWHVLLTKRSDRLAEHSGQVAFPGGRSDPQDHSPEETALREAQEEIGLDPNVVNILGRLESLITITNYRVSPVVGVIQWPVQFTLASEEVDRVFIVPLEWLANPQHYEVRQRVIPLPYSIHFGSESYPIIYFQPYQGETLWGVSAEITMRLISLLK